MTREEAVKRIKEIQKLYVFTPTINEALDLAIESLKEPITIAKRIVDNAPSVTPTERTGEWVVHPLIDDGRVELECSECGDTFVRAVDYKPDFCENCGAKMGGDTE